MIPGIPEHLIDTADKTVIGGDGIAIKGSPFWIRIKNRTTWTVTGYLRGPDHDKISNNVEDARDLVKGPLDPNKSCAKDCAACVGQYAFFVGNQEAKFWVRFVAENAQNEQAISIAFPISPSTSAASFPCCLEEDLLQPVLIGAKKPGFKFAAKAAPKIGVAQSAAARRGSAAIKGSPYWIRLKNRTSCTVTGYLTGPDAGSIPENAAQATDLVDGPLAPDASCAAGCDACDGRNGFFVGDQDDGFSVKFVAQSATNELLISDAWDVSPNPIATGYDICLDGDDVFKAPS